jgi:hypothetical protein
VTGQIIGPRSQMAPTMVQIQAMDTATGVVLDTLRDRLIVALAPAIVSRESSTLAPSGHLGRLVVNLADAILAARDAQSVSPASSALPALATPAGS